jgi:DNA-directed RNA polymerase sigma subunit (sigma70/sigma32)
VAWIGVIGGARNYDPGRNIKFATYVMYRIRGVLSQAVTRKTNIVRKTPAGATRVSAEVVDRKLPLVGTELRVREMLGILDDRERDIVVRRLGLYAMPEQFNLIGLDYGICRERVRQILKKSLEKIRKDIST